MVVRYLKSGVEFFFKNFLVPLAFFITFEHYGKKPAIGLALLVTVGQFTVHRLLRHQISPFFIVASGFTLIFGSLDLLIADPRYYRLEPFAQNLLLGQIFLASLAIRRPIVGWFVEGLPREFKPDLSRLSKDYVSQVTLAWAAYFLIKSYVFLIFAYQFNLGMLVIYRSILGGSTILMMLLGEYAVRKYLSSRRGLRTSPPQTPNQA